MLQKIVRVFGGDPNKRQIEKYTAAVDQINGLEAPFEALSDDALHAKTDEFRRRLVSGETLDDILPEAFAAVREASKRTLGQRHYDVQLIGGITLHQGKIAEMRTGEGKTLVATLPLYLNALAFNPAWLELAARLWGNDPATWTFFPLEGMPVGRGVHLVTVNDYLARRDARWMGVIYHALGLNVGVLQMAARTEEGRKAFLVDPERPSPHEDQHHLRMVPRREAYAADMTYGTNSEYGFDYLRDNMTIRLEDRVQRCRGETETRPYYAIVDEVDNVLIDEARTPLIISGPAHDDTEWYIRMAQVVQGLSPEDYEINEKDHTVTLSEAGEAHVEELLGVALRDPERPEDATLEQARLMGYLEQALRAQFLFRRNKEYLVQGGKVVIVDEFTGRLMPGRRWSDGLHQAVEAKEGVRVQRESVTYATITIQNYFRMYEKLAGMSGTALTEAEEFDKIYKLGVLPIPTNLEYLASRADSPLVVEEDRDAQGYRFEYYADRNDSQGAPLFWKRKDYPDIVYRTEEAKLRAITREIMRYHARGQPVLVGTTSVELSERVSSRLRAEPVRRLAQVLLLRDAWMKANQREEDGRLIPELAYLNGAIDQLPLADMRKMTRDLGTPFNPQDAENQQRLLTLLGLNEAEDKRLTAILEGGIPHQVLNARKHTEESQIIAGAGAFGAVTIATNMAGRGVDIKLGGELADEVLAAVNRVLYKNGHPDPYDMKMDERYRALLALDPADFGIHEAEVGFFRQYMEDMERVQELGGLHIIGSERHEARRIDNQLRGRAARQGDPGSSRFYLSMEDELMRLFGGQQADALMQRLRIDDSLPLEVAMVGRIIEQAQTRVEGQNFDVRKHLLEYDDVLNTQRAKIYAQRDRIFTKDDLSEDVTEMLQTEVLRRVPEALKDAEGPWKLLAWLEQIQPPLPSDGVIFPSYPLYLLSQQLTTSQQQSMDVSSAIRDLLDLVQQSLRAEEEHIIHSIENLLDSTEERLKGQIAEKFESIETFFEGLKDEDEDSAQRSPRQLAEELAGLLRLPLKLSPEEQRALRDDPRRMEKVIRAQVEVTSLAQAVTRSLGAVARRLEEDIELDHAQLDISHWRALTVHILDAIHAGFERRRERLIGKAQDGAIARDLRTWLEKTSAPLSENQYLALLINMAQGTRAAFDRRTHRRIVHHTTRLTYVYHAARLLEDRDPEAIAAEVLEHLQQAHAAIRRTWGAAEWSRLSPARPADLDERAQRGLQHTLGENHYSEIKTQPFQLLQGEERALVVDELGRQALTEIYRQVLLGVISEIWVEYLTSMEALRVSIGLEAYAQRDPLVQYKNRASEMFQELLSNMRLGVVSRMFTFRPRDLSNVQATVATSRVASSETTAEEPEENHANKQKRRRRRH